MSKAITVTEQCGMADRYNGFGHVKDADVPARLKKRKTYDPKHGAVLCHGCDQIMLLTKEGRLPFHNRTYTRVPRGA